MRVMLIGGGGREHCLAWKISQSPLLEELICCPGNVGISSLARCLPVKETDLDGLLEVALQEKIEMVVVGPEAPLALGIKDHFAEKGIPVFGPGREGAKLESSKTWAKDLMSACSIPTAAYAVFQEEKEALNYVKKKGVPIVIKADGLAAGKGVTVAKSMEEASIALHNLFTKKVFGDAGKKVVIEDCLEGEEVSVLAVTDGKDIIILPSAQDHKAAWEGDKGPNTGGMGAYSPAPVLSKELEQQVREQVFLPLLAGLEQRNIDYKGVIYAGLMVNKGILNVLEFNVRFGDPETQVLLPLIKTDICPLLYEAARGNLRSVHPPEWFDRSAACVVLSSQGYPGEYEKGKEITGLEKVSGLENAAVFHAGTAFVENRTVTAGGRVLGLTAWDSSLGDALGRAYKMAGLIDFEGKYFRRDIGYRALR